MPSSRERTNVDRAEGVAELVATYATEHYFGTEYVQTVVQDLITDLGHYLDSGELPATHIGTGPTVAEVPFSEWVGRALDNYDEEAKEQNEQI